MNIFDLHCDTLSEIRAHNEELNVNNRHISYEKAAKYEKYSQVFAVWSVQSDSDEQNYEDFFKTVDYAKPRIISDDSRTPYLAVEGAKLLCGRLERLDALYNAGVRFLTLVWGDFCCIGGAHDTDEGLTDFGKAVVRRCFELGIVPDLSHSSLKTFDDAFGLAVEYGKPVICTHSNSRALCEHRRDLYDNQFKLIRDIGGIVGISMCRPHLSTSQECNIDTIVSHIERFLSLGGEKTVCLGCDLDGIGTPPDGIESISDLYKIFDRLARMGYSDTLIADISFNNAQSFVARENISPWKIDTAKI